METPDQFDFPYEPYDIQHSFMKTLYQVLENRKLGIFESPTGTGKSLSIICGAIRWLKDHNENERNSVIKKIENLEEEKLKVATNSTDWLSSQAEEIAIVHRINELKIEQNKINEYDRKITRLKTRKQVATKVKWQKPKSEETIEILPEIDEKAVEDEDILLEENISDSNESDDEEDNNKYKPTKIFICSRTHSQLAQFVGEILKSPFAKDIRVASLASRQNYCINHNVSKLKNNSLINERCLDIQKQIKKQSKVDPDDGKVFKRQKGTNCKCPFYKQSSISELRDLALTEVQDIENLVTNGKKLNACPYYASRLAAEDAEIVLVPYNTILHKPTREANGIDLRENVVIIDEAHNLLEAMAQMHNCELSYNQIQQGLHQLKCYKHRFNTRFSAHNLLCINQLIFVLGKLQQLFDKCTETKIDTFTVENFVLTAQIDNYNMFRLVKFCRDSRIAQKVRCYAIKYPLEKEIVEKPTVKKGVKDFLMSIENKNPVEETPIKTPIVPTLTNSMLPIISFLQVLTYSYSDGRIFVHQTSDKSKSKLQFLLLNSSQNFKDIVAESRSVIVAGGTMKPISEFRNRLFLNSGADPGRIVEFSCDHIIPMENLLPLIVTEGPGKEKLLFTYEHRMSMGNCIKSVLEECCKTVPGGIVAFFPSYSYENWVWEQIKLLNLGRSVFREPQDSGSVEAVLKKYSDAIRKPSSPGALLLSVVGGKLSEGLNFNDDLGRCIIVVGMPYANITAPDLKEKMSYLDRTEGSGSGRKFYEGLCMKAVNQSIGRAVRHKSDYATILLLDERYSKSSNKQALPDWIRRLVKVSNFEETFEHIQKFFKAKHPTLHNKA